MAEKKEIRDYYEIRQGRNVLSCGSIPFMGYHPAVLLDMHEHGLYLYKNGKRVKKCEITLA